MTVCIGIHICNNAVELPFIFDSIERIQDILRPDNVKIPIIIAYDESYDTSLGFLLSKLDHFQLHILKKKTPSFLSTICDDRILQHIRDFFPETEYLLTIQPNGFTYKTDSLPSICELHIYPKTVFSLV